MRSTFLDNMATYWEAIPSFSSSLPKDKKSEYFMTLLGINPEHPSINSALNESNVASVKKLMLEVFEHLIDGDSDGSRKRAIIRRLSFENLIHYFIDTYD